MLLTFSVPRDPGRVGEPQFTCGHAAVDDASRVTVTGELDLATAPCLEPRISWWRPIAAHDPREVGS